MIMQTILDTLISSFNHDSPLGLANGKMGFCLYAFWLARVEKSEAYQEAAENLLDDIMNRIDTLGAVDVVNGLSGIGLAIRYLIKESCVKGNPNVILSDLDDMVFKHLGYSTRLEHINALSATQILFYLCVRLSDQKKGSESEYLYRELIIAAVNHIYQKADASFFEEPLPFGTNYLLPQFLFVLSKIYQLDFYNYRIIKILEEISMKILSTLPTLHANRLFLMWGMDSVVQQVEIQGWKSHIHLLKEQLNMDTILDDELRSRNIYIDGGFSGIYLLLSALQKYFSENEVRQWMVKIMDRIESSDVWTLVEREHEYLLQHRGLVSGLCGVSIVLADAKSKYSHV